ncbi:hypothetical protein FOZ60_016300 [Perkinsus olseni]|uniref:Uncharacterized protein n=1 Tax=Perkinsus olseni TaxID=32597 RepID=A0A7J6P4P4_PEROL|nr:hypothetical protein FOZ60_016300 [Perkinsus olseni]
MRSPLVAAVGLALTVPVVEAAMAAVLSAAAQHSAGGSATAHTKGRKGNGSKRVRSVLRSLVCMGRKCEKDDVNAKTKEPYRVWDRCSLSYTFPVGPSTTEEQSNLGGIIVHAKQLVRRGKPTPRRTALDYIYVWGNGQYNNTNRMNVMLDVGDIVPGRISSDPEATCKSQTDLWGEEGLTRALQSKTDLTSTIGEDGLVSVAAHVSGILGEIWEKRLTEVDVEVVPAFIWSLAHDKLHQNGSYYYLCPPITISTKTRTAAIRLGATDPNGKLKLHDIDIVGDAGEHSEAVCEAQLVEYGRTIQDFLDRLMDNTEKSILFEELNEDVRIARSRV